MDNLTIATPGQALRPRPQTYHPGLIDQAVAAHQMVRKVLEAAMPVHSAHHQRQAGALLAGQLNATAHSLDERAAAGNDEKAAKHQRARCSLPAAMF